jgi:hypothetical protein
MLYDVVKIEWANSCDVDNTIYSTGFINKLFIECDEPTPIYEIENKGKKTKGTNKNESQTWFKRYELKIACIESMATILSTLPLHDWINFYDKKGNVYECSGADIDIDTEILGNEEEQGEVIQPIIMMTITFIADLINKRTCCTNKIVVECSGIAPIIDAVTEPTAGEMILEAIVQPNELVRTYAKKFVQPFTITGTFMDLCIISSTLSYAVSKEGVLIKSIDNGITWTLVKDVGTPLYCICYNGSSRIFVAGTGGYMAHFNIGSDTLVVYALAPILGYTAIKAVDATNIVLVSTVGTVVLWNGSAFSAISGTATNLSDLEVLASGVVMAVGPDYVGWRAGIGIADVWTEITLSGKTATSICYYENNQFFVGTSDGKVYLCKKIAGSITATLFIPSTVNILGIAIAEVNSIKYLYIADHVKLLVSNIVDNSFKTMKLLSSPNGRIRAIDSIEHSLIICGKVMMLSSNYPWILISTTTAQDITENNVEYTGVDNCGYTFKLQTFLLDDTICDNSDQYLFST